MGVDIHIQLYSVFSGKPSFHLLYALHKIWLANGENVCKSITIKGELPQKKIKKQRKNHLYHLAQLKIAYKSSPCCCY
uniref:Ovule protein n=1 Tax=Romanomermis culicivorax TaxID=13658 RepID=A0A915KZR5_ROMCU